ARVQALLVCLALVAGCRSRESIDGRKYFHHGDPLAAVEAFAFAIAAYDLQFLSDLSWVEEGDRITFDETVPIQRWVHASQLSEANAEIGAAGTQARVSRPIRAEKAGELGLEQAEILLRSELKVEETPVWLVDVRATLGQDPAGLARHGSR